jgi:hypothetical protein
MAKRAKIDLRPPSPPPPEPASTTRPTTRAHAREGTRLLGAHLPVATVRRFAVLAASLDKSHQALLEEAIEDLFAKHAAGVRT